jgi:hypothetical protein
MYLDPSFGGMILQIIVAVIAGGGAIAFGFRRKIKALFKKNKGETPPKQYDQTGEVVDMMADDHEESKQ